MSEAKPPEGGDNVQISVGGDSRVEAGGVAGVDRSKDKTVFAQQNNEFNTVNNYFYDRPARDKWKGTRQFIALFSGLAMVTSAVAIAAYKTEVSDALYTFLRIMVALGGAAFAVCIDGFLAVRFKTWLRATGGFAVFAIIYLLPVARASSSKALPDSPGAPASQPATVPSTLPARTG